MRISQKLCLSICFLSFALVLFQSCSDSKTVVDGTWRVNYIPADNTRNAGMEVYSTKTGEYYHLFVEDGKWKKNASIPSPPINITKGDLRMSFMSRTATTLPGLNVYSPKTGEWQQFYLQEGKWIINPNFPQPNISIDKGDLRMEFIPGSANSLAGLNVYSTLSKKYEIFYLQDGKWKLNTAFPANKQL